MSRWLARLRAFAGHDDRREAFERERMAVQAASEVALVDRRFALEMERRAAGAPGMLPLGSSANDASVAVSIPLAELLRPLHALVTGGSGTGKTYAVVALVRALLRELVHRPNAFGLAALDPKSEFVPLLRLALAEVVRTVPEPAADALLARVVVINPFADGALVPFGVLRREPGVDPEATATDVASLISRMGGADLGVRQDALVFHLVLLGVDRGFTLPRLAELLSSPAALAREAALSEQPAVRVFFANGTRVSRSSLEGVEARLFRLLRIRKSRLMLGAEETIDVRDILANRILLVDTGSPPLGCEDIARFWTGLVMLKLTRGIFERTHEDGRRRPVLVFVDEWAEVLRATGGIAEDFERVLMMSRSRGVAFWLISQALASASRVSPTLPRDVSTNTTIQWLFRMAPEDARALRGALPITGRRPRAVGAPWEPPARSPFLTHEEERAFLEEELTRLPSRVFRFWEREQPYGAELVRTSELRLPPIRDALLAARLERGALARPIEELERAAAATADAAFRPRATAAPEEPRAARSRSRRPRRG